MKILPIGIIGLVFCALCIAGLFIRRMPVAPSTQKLVDMCPKEERPPVEKHPGVITSSIYGLHVLHTKYYFSFTFPKNEFRFEENTLQEYEEPIYLPTYLYTMLLTYGQTRTENHLAPYEIRFVVYPSWCNSEVDWTAFLQHHGWRVLSRDDQIPLFTAVEKMQSGRTYRRFFVHKNSYHYEFEESWDNTFVDKAASEGARKIIESFQLGEKEENK